MLAFVLSTYVAPSNWEFVKQQAEKYQLEQVGSFEEKNFLQGRASLTLASGSLSLLTSNVSKIAGMVSASISNASGIEEPYSSITIDPLSQQNDIELYFAELKSLQKEEKWEKIVEIGERASLQCQKKGDFQTEFSIVDQLVSSYFRLGDFKRAQEKGERLIVLGERFHNAELIVDSLYKLSAGVRGFAGEQTEETSQGQLFMKAKELSRNALTYSSLHCPGNKALRARVLFNAGAAECDDPRGDYSQGIVLYQEALEIFTAFKEEDYRQRTLLRLGKAYILAGECGHSREIIEQLKQSDLETRTRMHLYYLDAQVLKAENHPRNALSVANLGREIALQLHAQADLRRFDLLIAAIESALFPDTK